MSVQPTLRPKNKRRSRTRLSTGDYDDKPLSVLLVGPSLMQKGGMATVQNLVLNGMNEAMQVEHIATHEEGSLWHRIWFFVSALIAFVKALVMNHVSLVHLHVSEKGSVFRKIILLLIAKAFGRSAVMHTHGCEFHVFHANLPRWVRYGVNLSLQQADCVVALSESWRRYYISHCGLSRNRVVVLPNPVDIPAAVPLRSISSVISSAKEPPVRIAFLGRIGARKGAFDLIRAFAELPIECRERTQLMLAGDGDVQGAIALVDQLGLSQQITLMGWLSAAECKQLLATSHLFALPSYNEGLPMAVIEAMAWGLPVISTPVGGIPELISHLKTGYLVEPGDIDSLAKSMRFLIENAGVRESVGQKARERVLPLDIRLYCKTLSMLFHLVVENQLRVDYTGSLMVPERFSSAQPLGQKTAERPYANASAVGRNAQRILSERDSV